jgi:hypothetical protein
MLAQRGLLFTRQKSLGVRFTRLLAFATWVVIALLAMAAFAAFSPSSELTEFGAPSSTVPEAETTGTVPPGVGAAAGRQAAFGFSQDMLSLAAPDTTTTTTSVPPPTTTTIAPTTTTSTLPPATTTTAAATTNPRPRTDAPIPPDQVYALVSAYFKPQDVERAVLIAWCESRYDANATNPSSGAAGLFQHIPRFWAGRSTKAGVGGADIYDPSANTAVAAWLVYANGGWRHWNASISCWGNGTVVPPSTTTTTVTPTTVSPTTVPTAPSTTTTTTIADTTLTTVIP